MKLSYVGAVVAFCAAALLAGCGGKAQYTVQGPIAGLATPGLMLSNGGETISVPAGATRFSFSRQVSYGTSYDVRITQQPDHMTCNFNTINTGSAGQTVAISVEIVCARRTYTVGGQFTGLFPKSLASGTTAAVLRTVTLLNGSGGGAVTLSSPADNSGVGDFTFPVVVADGQSYGVTIHPDPSLSSDDINCTVTNGSGVMGEAAVTNLLVACTPRPK